METRHDLKKLKDLPKNLINEYNSLLKEGINTWNEVKKLEDTDLNNLLKISKNLSLRNLKFIRGMASLIDELDLPPKDAALLMHSGVSTVSSLALLNPNDLLKRIGRLERQLHTHRNNPINLASAKSLINRARNRQLLN